MEKRFIKSVTLLKSSRLLSITSITLLSVGLLLSPQHVSAKGGDLLTSQEREWLAVHPLIRLAPDPDYAPIEYFDEKRNYQGIAADYIALIEKRLGFRFKISHLQSWDEALDKARRKDIDMFGAAAQTPQRSEYMLFTHPFAEFPSVIIVRKRVSESLSLEKLGGMKVAVVSGYADYDYIKNDYPRLQLDGVPSVVTGLRKVSFGMVDALVANLASATYYIEKEGITNLHLAGKTGYTFRLGFGVRKDWPELIVILEKGLAAIPPNEREAIFRKWVKLEEESLLARREFRFIVLPGLGIALFSLLGLLLWNRSLKSAVSLRTQELSSELAERKRADEALRESEDRYRDLVENSQDLMCTHDLNGAILSINPRPAQLLGYRREDLLGMNIRDVLVPEVRHKFKEYLDEIKNNHIACGLMHVQTIEGERRIWKYNNTLRTEGVRQAMVRGMAQDVTEQVRVEEELRKSRDELELRVEERTAELTEAYDGLKQSERQLKHLSSKLLRVQETERKRVANEIHDSVGQSLHAIRVGLKDLLAQADDSSLDAGRVCDILAAAEFGIEEVKNLYMGLRPSLIDDLGLVATMGWYLREFRKAYPGLQLEEDISVEEEKVGESIKITIFRVLQGALDNVVRHSGASQAQVSLKEVSKRLELLVRDNGGGFDSGEFSMGNGHMEGIGLVSMQERVESSGGIFSLRTAKGEGTTIRAVWDLDVFA